MRPEVYDVIIIGGGLAGSTAAFHLAKKGYEVLVIEKEAEPHHKVCGEFLSAEALPYLEEMDVDLEALGAQTVRGVHFYSRKFHHHFSLLSVAKSLSRFRLDEALLNRARQKGAQLLRGLTVTHFESIEKGGYVVQASGKAFLTKSIFLATGKHEIKKLHIREGKENSALGFKWHLKLSLAAQKRLGENVALYFYRGGYAGLCAIENNLSNLCFILDKNIYRKLGNNFESVWNYLKKENEPLQQMLNESEIQWSKPVVTANIPYGYVHTPKRNKEIKQGIYYLGDQFAVIPSLTGLGMTIALLTGKEAAEHFDRQQKGELVHDEGESGRHFRSAVHLSYPLHGMLQFPFWADSCVLLLKIFPQLSQYGLRKINGGKWCRHSSPIVERQHKDSDHTFEKPLR